MTFATGELETLISGFQTNPGASQLSIRQFEMNNFTLPTDFCEFLLRSNGGEGAIVEKYLVIWSLEELIAMNGAYQVSQYAPAIFLFGSDGAGEGFGFDRREDGLPIVALPFIGMNLAAVMRIAPDFASFLRKERLWG